MKPIVEKYQSQAPASSWQQRFNDELQAEEQETNEQYEQYQAQQASSSKDFSDALRFLRQAKDLLTTDVLAKLDYNSKNQYSSITTTPSDLASLKTQLSVMQAINNSLMKASEQGDFHDPIYQKSLDMLHILAAANDAMNRIRPATAGAKTDSLLSLASYLLKSSTSNFPEKQSVGPIITNVVNS